MKTLALATALSLTAGATLAQPAPVGGLPKMFDGYIHHDITPGLCHAINPGETQCTIPEMTAGYYEITATGTSTATAAGAQQKLTVQVGGALCGNPQTNVNPAWAPSTAKTLRYSCVVGVVTDNAMTVRAIYADAKATKDSKGPTLAIRRLPWPGVLNIQGGAAAQQ